MSRINEINYYPDRLIDSPLLCQKATRHIDCIGTTENKFLTSSFFILKARRKDGWSMLDLKSCQWKMFNRIHVTKDVINSGGNIWPISAIDGLNYCRHTFYGNSQKQLLKNTLELLDWWRLIICFLSAIYISRSTLGLIRIIILHDDFVAFCISMG